jgi:hypothetical protein
LKSSDEEPEATSADSWHQKMVRSLSEGQADLQTWWTVFNEKEKAFVFHPGPVFCNIFLADEINRASPKVQSALLQAMQERTVDADGTSSLSNKKSMKPSASARRSWIIFSICAVPPVRAGISGRNSSLTSD